MEKLTIRMNGSSYIYDMDMGDRYTVINKSLWISLLSLVGNPTGARFEVKEPVSPLLTMDLEKRLADSLEEEPADFLVVDMCYTAGHALCKWKDQVFTKNPKLLESSFYAEHKDEMEEIDVMRDDEFDWKPYMDRYIELIGKYFDKNHIILVKSRCPLWYVTHTHVRPLKKKSRRVYNKRIKQLEDYFIGKTDPYVVDIYSHYYVDFNHKRGYTMSSYEKPFYHHARRLVSMIMRKQPEKRVFQDSEYFVRLGRFIKYYHNLFAKNRTALLMDDNVFLDHLVLQLSREILAEYETDFVEMEARGYGSMEEILENYDFRFAGSLRTCLEVVKAVEEGDIFRENVEYQAIFEYHLKIADKFTTLVENEVKKAGLLEGAPHINPFRCQHYYHALLAARTGKEKAFQKEVLELGEDMREKLRLRELVREETKRRGRGIPALCEAMNRFYEPIPVDLWGSCITREILNEDDGRFSIGKYAYRNSFLFAFDDPIPYDETNYDDLSLFENSEWRLGYIQSAFRKDLPKQLEKTGSKWLLLDFYDLICDITEYHGGYLTADSEVRGLKFYKKIKQDCRQTSIQEELTEAEIKKRFDRFLEFVQGRYGENIIFIRADVKTRFLDYERHFKKIRGYKQETLLKKKEFLNRWQDYFQERFGGYVIDYAEKYQADDLCVSGAFMVHYEKEFYEKGYRALKEIIYKENGEKWRNIRTR